MASETFSNLSVARVEAPLSSVVNVIVSRQTPQRELHCSIQSILSKMPQGPRQNGTTTLRNRGFFVSGPAVSASGRKIADRRKR